MSQIKPYFERCLKLPKSNPGAALAEGKTQLTTSVLPVYVAGILGCFSQVSPCVYTTMHHSSLQLTSNTNSSTEVPRQTHDIYIYIYIYSVADMQVDITPTTPVWDLMCAVSFFPS